MTVWPSVGVVLPTHDRPGPLRTALAAVLAQNYPGELRAVVVYDRAEPDPTLADSDRVTVVANVQDARAGRRPQHRYPDAGHRPGRLLR